MKDLGWGSRPVPGRDWGATPSCSSEIIQALTARFTASFKSEGSRDSFGARPSLTSLQNATAVAFDLAPDFGDTTAANDEPLDEEPAVDERTQRRRRVSFAKHRRMSLWASTTQPDGIRVSKQKPLFGRQKSLGRIDETPMQTLDEYPASFAKDDDLSSVICETGADEVSTVELLEEDEILPTIFSFLTERELILLRHFR